jgi:transcriptional regulator with XRE-family HTH domain
MTGTEFKAELVALGLTQQEFAARFGVLPGTVSRWVRDRRGVPLWVPTVLKMLRQRDG